MIAHIFMLHCNTRWVYSDSGFDRIDPWAVININCNTFFAHSFDIQYHCQYLKSIECFVASHKMTRWGNLYSFALTWALSCTCLRTPHCLWRNSISINWQGCIPRLLHSASWLLQNEAIIDRLTLSERTRHSKVWEVHVFSHDQWQWAPAQCKERWEGWSPVLGTNKNFWV